MKAAKIAMKAEPFYIAGRVPAKDRAARVDLHQSEDRIREQIEREIEEACKATDAGLVWEALGALRIAEAQGSMLASMAKINGMKSERMERELRGGVRKPRRRKTAPKGDAPLSLVQLPVLPD